MSQESQTCPAACVRLRYLADLWGKCKEAHLRHQSWSNLMWEVFSVGKHAFSVSVSSNSCFYPSTVSKLRCEERRCSLSFQKPSVCQEVVRWETPYSKWDSVTSVCPFQSESPLLSEIYSLSHTIPSNSCDYKSRKQYYRLYYSGRPQKIPANSSMGCLLSWKIKKLRVEKKFTEGAPGTRFKMSRLWHPPHAEWWSCRVNLASLIHRMLSRLEVNTIYLFKIVLTIIIWKYYYSYVVKPADQEVTAIER